MQNNEFEEDEWIVIGYNENNTQTSKQQQPSTEPTTVTNYYDCTSEFYPFNDFQFWNVSIYELIPADLLPPLE